MDGLRERKKTETRRRIADAAIDLFADRGFDHVTVAEVGRAADVSTATVFNYFPTKEDLVYFGMQSFEQALVDALANRPPGTSLLEAFRSFVLRPRGALDGGDAAAIHRVGVTAAVVAGSTTLQARERQIFDRTVDDLAGVIAEQTQAAPDDIRPWVTANALLGINRALSRTVQEHARRGRRADDISAAVIEQGRRALDLLEHGLTG